MAVLRRWIWNVVAIAILLVARSANAEPSAFEGALLELAQPAPEAVARAVDALARSGDPRALAVLEGLRDGGLSADAEGHVFVRSADGKVRNVLTGAEATGGGHTPPVDNAVRRALGPALARLVLVSETATTAARLAAVEELAADDDALPALRAAKAVCHDAAVERAIGSVIAQHELTSDDPELRLEAVASIERAANVTFLPKLRAHLTTEIDPRVRAAEERAIAALARKQTMLDGIANALYGLSTGSVLLLAALGLAITFGLMGVINMAHGEMLMIGAYATYATQLFFRAHFPEHRDFYLLAAIPVAFAASALTGALIERTVVRYLYGRPIETLLATWGVSLVLIQTVRLVFGAQNVAVENPQALTGGVAVFEGVVLPYNRIAVVVFAAVVVLAVSLVLKKTRLGLRVRAVTQNRAMASCMGIATGKVDTWTFALGSAFGGLGGVALSQLGNVGPELGQSYIVDSFLVVVLGGVGKVVGTVVAALGLGMVDKLLEPVAGAVIGKIVVLLGVIVVIQKRPQGLFAPRGRAVES